MLRERVDLPWGWAEAEVGPKATVIVGDHVVPRRVEVVFAGVDGQPRLEMRFAVVNGVPQCRELHLTSADDGRDIRPLDLDAIHLSTWVEDVYSLFANRIVSRDDGQVIAVKEATSDADGAAVRAMHRARRGNGARKMTPELLARVADIYRAHLDDAPTKAVASSFGVKTRMASYYVQQARETGLLEPRGSA